MRHPSDCEDSCCIGSTAPARFPSGIDRQAQVFRALGDEIRLRVLHLVKNQEACVCDLMEVLKMPQGTLSHHLGVLAQAGLVTARKQGRWNYYQATAAAKEPLTIFEEP